MGFIGTNLHWFWLALGLLLILAEMYGGSGYLFVAGSSAIIMGAITFVSPELSYTWQLVIYTVLVLSTGAIWTLYFRKKGSESSNPSLGIHGAEYIGRKLVLTSDIKQGRGSFRLDDANWRLRCDKDLISGTEVEVIGVEGNTLLIAETESR